MMALKSAASSGWNSAEERRRLGLGQEECRVVGVKKLVGLTGFGHGRNSEFVDSSFACFCVCDCQDVYSQSSVYSRYR